MSDFGKNPFRPDAEPLHRTGHEVVAERLTEHLETLRTGIRGNVIVMFGPRGNGKKTLLGELRDRAQEGGLRVVSAATGALDGDLAKLASMIAPKRKQGMLGIRRLMAGAFGCPADIEFSDFPGMRLEAAFRETLGKSPLVLIVDEAHELPPRLGGALLQLSQILIGERLPLLVVLAGAPGLPSALHRTGAGFWERYRRLRIGLLESEEATRQAFAVPAEGSGYPIDEDALDALVRESQHYPFFVQQLGWDSWRVASGRFNGGGGPRRITLRDAQGGINASKATILDFYRERRVETENQRVLAEAVAVSKAMITVGEGKALSEKDLMEALSSVTSDDDSILAAKGKLLNLSLVWEMPEGHWEPGIPSLCKYIATRGTWKEVAGDGKGGVAHHSGAGAP